MEAMHGGSMHQGGSAVEPSRSLVVGGVGPAVLCMHGQAAMGRACPGITERAAATATQMGGREAAFRQCVGLGRPPQGRPPQGRGNVEWSLGAGSREQGVLQPNVDQGRNAEGVGLSAWVARNP